VTDPFLQPILVWTGNEAGRIDAFMAPGESNTESLCRAHRVTDHVSSVEGTSKPEQDEQEVTDNREGKIM